MQMRVIGAVAAIVSLGVFAAPAAAQPAHCYTTDDGEYDCDFVATDSAGSFDITAPDKPSFSLIVEEPGVASGFGEYGTGHTPRPGRYYRSDQDPACWENDETGTEICAW